MLKKQRLRIFVCAYSITSNGTYVTINFKTKFGNQKICRKIEDHEFKPAIEGISAHVIGTRIGPGYTILIPGFGNMVMLNSTGYERVDNLND